MQPTANRLCAPLFARSRLLIWLALLGAVPLARAQQRTELPINDGWHFIYADPSGAEATAFNDASWQAVTLPHTWNALDGQDGVAPGKPRKEFLQGDYARGSGWYRRTVAFSPDWSGRRVYVQFDGASRRADVFVNGRLAGTHLGANARFRFDVTDLLRPGANTLAVRVNNEGNDIIPQSADFTFFGGLYRRVSLLVTDPLQIDAMDYASPGVYLRQGPVTRQAAHVDALVKLANHMGGPAPATVRVRVNDRSGALVAEGSADASLVAGGKADVTVPLQISAPHLWDGRADPYLYTVHTELLSKGAVRDAVDQPLGLRFFSVDPDKGFMLNGHYLDLHGVSRHQDREDKGWALADDDDRQDMALIAEMGCTAIRVAHYQQSPLWYELADETGMVLWSEVPFVDQALPSATFFNNALDQMRELIRQNYNHPSVFFWGCGNENFDQGQGFAEGVARYAPMSERLIQALNALAHAEDPTRLTTYASFHSESDVHLALPGQPPANYIGEPQRWYTDLTAFNKYYGWYYGEPEDAATFFDGLHSRNPGRCIGVSEYGAGGAITQHAAGPFGSPRVPMESMRAIAFAKVHPEEYQAYYHERTWAVLSSRPYIWAKFVWNMFDFASDGRNEGDHPGRNDKGLVTFDRRVRKDAFYFYKAAWSAEPVVHITGSRYTQRNAGPAEVKVYSNAPSVELFANGHSLGTVASASHVFIWPAVPLAAGRTDLKAVAAFADGPHADTCSWDAAAAPAR